MLTKCRLGETIFYVRENLAVPGGHFHVSAGERMGWKQGRLSRRHLQVLELAAPAAQWKQIASIVQEADALQRSVRANRRFTMTWAEGLFQARTPGKDAPSPIPKEDSCPSRSMSA